MRLLNLRRVVIASTAMALLMTLLGQIPAQAQSSVSIDTGFNSGPKVSGNVYDVEVQSDDKILVGTNFGITRLNSDGSIDESFNAGGNSGANGTVRYIEVQANGQILIAGRFTSFNGEKRLGMARLESDGTLDMEFDPDESYSLSVTAIAIQPDQKILIASQNRLWRLESDGSLDTSFSRGTRLVKNIALQSDGKIIINGFFDSYGGVSRNDVARLNQDGSIDPTFDPGLGAEREPGVDASGGEGLVIQPDGKILVSGDFSSFNGQKRNSIVRLNPNGSVDGSFIPQFEVSPYPVNKIFLRSDGKIVTASDDYYDNYNSNILRQFNSSGEIDTNFNPEPATGVRGVINSIALFGDDRLLLVGTFTLYNDVVVSGIARIFFDGSFDSSFSPPVVTGVNGPVSRIFEHIDGKSIITGGFPDYDRFRGGFTAYNGIRRNGIARINSDGTLDESFNPGSSAGMSAMAVQSDGKILVVASFVELYEDTYPRLARLNSDGSFDDNFSTPLGGTGIRDVFVQADGKILVGGLNLLIRLNEDGTIDSTFNVGNGFNVGDDVGPRPGGVSSINVQSNGQIIIGGNFISYDNTERIGLARLNADGSLDMSFNPEKGVETGDPSERGNVKTIAIRDNGKIVIGGQFSTYAGVSRIGLAQVNSDGSLDASFNVGNNFANTLSQIELLGDGKLLVNSGQGYYRRSGISRLNLNGDIDTTFYAPINRDLCLFGHASVLAFKVNSSDEIVLATDQSYNTFYNEFTLIRLINLTSYSVQFNANHNNYEEECMSPQHASSPTSLTRNFFSRDGFTFTGWNTAANGSGTSYADGAEYVFNQDTTLYAQWESIPTVIFLPNSGRGTMSSQSSSSPATLLSNSFTRTGYTFAGWNTTANGSGTSYPNGATYNFETNLTLFAQWTLVPGPVDPAPPPKKALLTIDKSFNPGPMVSRIIYDIAVQSDGKILLGTNFGVTRLNVDGTLDPTFTPPSLVPRLVRSIAIQPNGKILISGPARLNSDGSLDTSFDADVGGTIIALQPDGKIVLDGIKRLNTNGSLDPTFDTGYGPNFGPDDHYDQGRIDNVAIQPDGKILVSGVFSYFDEVARRYIARLNVDGSLDLTFDPGASAEMEPGDGGMANGGIATQSNGKIVITGSFVYFGGHETNSVARLNPDGSVDSTFAYEDERGFMINEVYVSNAGEIFIGMRRSFNFSYHDGLRKLNSDGTLSTTFNPAPALGANGQINSIAEQPDGKLLIGGTFTSYNNVSVNGIIRVNADGSLDESFNPPPVTGVNDVVHAITEQPDGKLLIGGEFTAYNGVPRIGIARLNTDGTLDNSFDPNSGPEDKIYFGNTSINAIAIQQDGKILVGGQFTSFNGEAHFHLVRLNIDGTVDSTFVVEVGAISEIRVIEFQSDGKILVGGRYTFARLNVDGSLDSSFDPSDDFNYQGGVSAIALQPDGKIVIGGSFSTYFGAVRNGLARINHDGTLDLSFDPGSGVELYEPGWTGEVKSIAIRANGKILISGDFVTYDGVTRNGLAQVNPDGSLDSNFVPDFCGGDRIIQSMVIENDKILISGFDFCSEDVSLPGGIAIVNSNGKLHATFEADLGENSLSPIIVGKLIMSNLDQLVLFGSEYGFSEGLEPRLMRFDVSFSFAVIFNSNGGTGSMTPQISAEPASLKPNTFLRSGYRFTGWNTAANGAGTRYANRATYDFTADLVLYAQWEEVQAEPEQPEPPTIEPPINTDPPIQEIVPQPLPKLDPIKPGDNPNLPATGLTPGSSTVLINGIPQPVATRTNSTIEPTQIEIEINGSITRLAGIDESGRPLKLTTIDGKPVLLLEPEGKLSLDSAGFLPDTEVTIWLFSEPKLLGTFKTNSNGTLSGSVSIPETALGNHMLQINGITPQRTLKSLSIGLVVKKPEPVKPIITSIKQIIQFNKNSAKLTASGIRALSEVFSSKNGALVKITVKGFTQKGELKNNQRALSMARAKAVSSHIKSLGISTLPAVKNGGVFKKPGETGRRVVLTVGRTSNP